MRWRLFKRRHSCGKLKIFIITVVLIISLLYFLNTDGPEKTEGIVTVMSVTEALRELDIKRIERRISVLQAEKQAQRLITVLEGCQLTNNSDWVETWSQMKQIPKFPHDPLISRDKHLFYCPVGKVASTFLTRWVLAMEKSGPMTSPFTIPIQNAKRERADSLSEIESPAAQREFLNSSVKVVFGRDPFARVFSAYIDKMFRPDFHYWKTWGVKALTASNAKVERCGSWVTFQQFVQFAMTPGVLFDKHLRPVSMECQMCQMQYDVIGQVESIATDLGYISEKINVSSQFLREKNYSSEFRLETVKVAVFRIFANKDQIRKCISMDEMGKRIWRELEIRGLKDASVMYPFKPGEVDKMTDTEFLAACEVALSQSTNETKLKRQKKQAMDEVYLTLTPSNGDLILRAFEMDFVLFGYPTKPPYLYSASYRAGIKPTNVLDWNSPWLLS